jgi:predicted type IV restriction endonuclease
MKDTLVDIREKITNGMYKNEEHVRLSLVSRILWQLGWDIWNPLEVNCEYNVSPDEDKSKVDIALFLTPRKPDVFIEVKAIGKIGNDLARTEIQLRDYNRDNTALFSVITDGQSWRFYFSQAGGKFSDKCFKSVNLLEDDLSDVEDSLNRFLAKDAIENGSAATEAKNYLRLNEKQRAMEDKLSEAKRAILLPPYPSLPGILVTLVAEEGFQITTEEAQNFIKEVDSNAPATRSLTLDIVKPILSDTSNEQRSFDPCKPPNLLFTKILEAKIDMQRANNWNNLLSCAIKVALQKRISVNELQSISVPVKEGQVNTDGYSPLPGTGVSFCNVDANRAWQLTLSLAKKLKMEVLVKFKWREKEGAAYPGKEGMLHWSP